MSPVFLLCIGVALGIVLSQLWQRYQAQGGTVAKAAAAVQAVISPAAGGIVAELDANWLSYVQKAKADAEAVVATLTKELEAAKVPTPVIFPPATPPAAS